MTVWQVAGGKMSRNYKDVFIDHDVMLIGPGSPGKYPADSNVYSGNRTGIRSFAEDPKHGDVVLLRMLHDVVAVGVIPEKESGYEWGTMFDDVLGWPLHHYRRVLWGDKKALRCLRSFRKKSFFGDRKQQPTFTRVQTVPGVDVGKMADALSRCIQKRKLKKLPRVPEPMKLDEVGLKLFAEGLSNASVEQVIEAIEKARRLMNWYDEEQLESRPTEHEIVAHLVVPLMLALGWSEQMMAVEWNNIDLAFFGKRPTDEDSCVMICEAKSLGESLDDAYRQAAEYVEKFKLRKCKTIITTDGARLYVYRRRGKAWPEQPTGYVNLERIREDHVLPKKVSAIETLISLVPSHIS